jgi:hypothetical protein
MKKLSFKIIAIFLLAITLWSGVGFDFINKKISLVPKVSAASLTDYCTGSVDWEACEFTYNQTLQANGGDASKIATSSYSGAKYSDGNDEGFWQGIVKYAGGLVTGTLGKTVMMINGIILQIIVIPVLSIFLRIAAAMLDMALNFTLSTTIYSTTSSGVVIVWTLIRDICNITFIFILLYTAIKTIIGSASADTKKMIANVIIAALLINFSLFITRIVIDVGNIMGVAIYNKILAGRGSGIDTILLASLGLSGIFGSTGTNSVFSVAFGVVSYLQVITMLTAFIVFMYAMLLMAARVVMLIFLAALSPIGFMGNILPKLSEYSKQWRETLYGQVMIAPIFLLFVYLIVNIASEFDSAAKAVMGYVDPTAASTATITGIDANTVAADAGTKITQSQDYLMFFKFVMIILLLIVAVKITKKMTGAIGAAVEKFGMAAAGIAVGTVTGGAAFAMKATAGRGLTKLSENKTLAEMATSKRTGLGGFATRFVGRKTSDILASGGKKDFDVRNTGLFKKSTDLIGEHTGIKVDYNTGLKIQKDGYTGMVKRRADKEEEFAKRLERAGVQKATNTEIQAKQQELNDSIIPHQARVATLKAQGQLNVQEAKELKRLEEEIKDIQDQATTQKVIEGLDKEKKVKRLKDFADVAETGIINKYILGAHKEAAKKVRTYIKTVQKSPKDQVWDMLAAATNPAGATAPATPPTAVANPPAGGGPATPAPCWVAEVLYGMDDQRTHSARLWAATNINWFTKLYRKEGKVWAKWLTIHKWAQPIVKPIWNVMAYKGRILALKNRAGNYQINNNYTYLLERIK